MTRLVKFFLLLLGILGIAFLIIGASLNAIVKAGIETIGPQILGTPVSLDDVDISLLGEGGSLQGTLTGLRIQNPPGFHTPHAVFLPKIRIRVNRDSILTNTVTIQEIVIDRPDVSLEEALQGKSNLATLHQRIKEYSQDGTSEPATPPPSPAESPETETKVHIQRVLIREGQIHVSVKGLQGQSLNLPLPDIQLQNIGKEGGGISFQQAAARLFEAIYQDVIQSAPGGRRLFGGQVEKLEGSIKDLGKNLGHTAEKVGKDLLNGLLK